MVTKKKASSASVLQPRFRLLLSGEIAMGPGKAELLRHIDETHSIRESADRMNMSYMRAWTLIKTMNGKFREPLVVTTRGGTHRGGAELTKTGCLVMALYDDLEKQARRATARTRRRLLSLLRR